MQQPSSSRGPREEMPNVIVFGEAGAGKSSVVNMLSGGKSASTSDRALGRTFDNVPYEKTISGMKFRIFDTIGLNEATPWSEIPRDVGPGLRLLIQQLADGVSLLVHVVRAPRVTETTEQNYRMFYQSFCQGK